MPFKQRSIDCECGSNTVSHGLSAPTAATSCHVAAACLASIMLRHEGPEQVPGLEQIHHAAIVLGIAPNDAEGLCCVDLRQRPGQISEEDASDAATCEDVAAFLGEVALPVAPCVCLFVCSHVRVCTRQACIHAFLYIQFPKQINLPTSQIARCSSHKRTS
jgi:hypothetical protein